jgi:hypothetical protein
MSVGMDRMAVAPRNTTSAASTWEIERKAAADGIELLFGDTLRTNEGMIGLARGRGFRLEPGLEPRLLRIRKRLYDAAPDVPCLRWSEIAAHAADCGRFCDPFLPPNFSPTPAPGVFSFILTVSYLCISIS